MWLYKCDISVLTKNIFVLENYVTQILKYIKKIFFQYSFKDILYIFSLNQILNGYFYLIKFSNFVFYQ